MKKRAARIARKTAETDISLTLVIEGTGKYEVSTGIAFLDHMLSLMCKHGLLDADLRAEGDLDVDDHHTVEDVGIVLGQALKKAVGDMRGIRRYGASTVPMDEAIAAVSLDVSGRPFLVYNVSYPKRSKVKDFDVDLVQDFLYAFVSHAGITLHVNVPYGRNTHHMVEAVFKALGRALREALEKDPRSTSIPSTKGVI